MSGHSKWSSIKHKKAAKDARRGKIFTKLIREISVAARLGGGDPDTNPRLRTAVAAAKAVSMPSENIERAIKKGCGELEGVSYEEVSYEGYGAGGAAIIAQVLTDNRNRTVAELRNLFSRYGGNLGEAGCVSWMFNRKSSVTVEKGQADEDRVMEVALEAGAEDVTDGGEAFEVVGPPERLEEIKEALERAGITVAAAEVTMMPIATVRLTGSDAAHTLRLLEALQDHDDVQNVAVNADFPDEQIDRPTAV